MPPSVRDRDDIADTRHVDGYKNIARFMGRTIRTVRNYAKTAVNPLPIYKVGGIMRLDIEDYERWLAEFRAETSRSLIDTAFDQILTRLATTTDHLVVEALVEVGHILRPDWKYPEKICSKCEAPLATTESAIDAILPGGNILRRSLRDRR